MSNCIDAAMNPVQRIPLRTFRDPSPGNTLIPQLVERNYAALGGCLVRNPPLRLRPPSVVVPLS